MRDTTLDRLYDALIETDATKAGGVPAVRVQIAASATITVTASTRMANNLKDRLADSQVQTNANVAGGAPAVHVRTV